MKRDHVMTALQAWLLAFLASFGAMEALVTSFDLPLERSWSVWAVCAAAALFCAVVSEVNHGGTALLLLGALAAWYLKGQKTALNQLLELTVRISTHYDLAYGIGHFRPAIEGWETGFVDWPVCIWGAAAAAFTALSVSKSWGAVIPLVMTGVPVALCFVTTDTPPAAWCLLCLTFSILMILFTTAVRREDAAQGNRLGLLCAVPLALALWALTLAVPRESYVNRSQEALEALERWVQRAADVSPEDVLAVLPTVPESKRTVDLEGLGDLEQSGDTVLYVRSDVGGTLYLRGQDYDIYDGRSWAASENRIESFSGSSESLGTVTVQTIRRQEQLYLPYYPDGLTLRGGMAKNESRLTSYTFDRTGLPGDLYTLLELSGEGGREPRQEYLALPAGSDQALRAIAEPLTRGVNSATRKAERIGEYVRSHGRYDKRPPRMDPGDRDFAVWFLEEADRGYCVHYATAAVALLRSVGVEARYVTGYMIRVQSGVRTAVTGENAHAWAEYYEPRLDLWIPLEATPGERQTAAPSTALEPEERPEPTALPSADPAEGEGQMPTHPSAPEQQEDGHEPASARLLGWIFRLAGIVLLAAAAELQRRVRLALRQYRQHRGTPNVQALARWREAERLARLLGEEPPERLRELAQKAKFSQHTLDEGELLILDGWLRKTKRRLNRQSLPQRLMYRYIYAVM